MARVIQVTPVLYAEDLDGMVRFLRDRVGFKLLVLYEGYAYLQRDAAGLRFLRGSLPVELRAAYLDVDDVDALYAELSAEFADSPNVLRINPDGPHDQSYGQREFTVFCPEGLSLIFGEGIFRDAAAWERAANAGKRPT